MHWGRGALGSRVVARQLLGLGTKRGYQPFNDSAPFLQPLQQHQHQVQDGLGGVGRGRGRGAPAPPSSIGRGGSVPERQPWESGGPFPGAAGGSQTPGFGQATQAQAQAQRQNGSLNRVLPAGPAGNWVQQGGLSADGSDSGGNRSIPGAEGVVRHPGSGQYPSNGNAAPPDSSTFSDAHWQGGGRGGGWVQQVQPRTDGAQSMGAAPAAPSGLQQGSDPSGLPFKHSQGHVLRPSQIQGFGPAHGQENVHQGAQQFVVPAQGSGYLAAEGQGQGVLPVQGQGFVSSQGFVSPQRQGLASGQVGGFVPSQGRGFTPLRSQESVSDQGQAFLSPQGQEFVSAQGQGFLPAQGQGFGAAQGQGFLPAQRQGFSPAHNQGFSSVESQRFSPAQSHSSVPAQSQGFVPQAGFGQGSVSSHTQGQGQNFVHPQALGSQRSQSFPSAQGKGFVSAQGQASGSAQWQNLGAAQGQASRSAQWQNSGAAQGQASGSAQWQNSGAAQGQGFGPPQGQGFGQGPVSSQSQGQNLVPSQGLGFQQGQSSPSAQGQGFVPAQRQGFVPAQEQVSGSIQWHTSGSAQGQGFEPAQGDGFGQASMSSQGKGQNSLSSEGLRSQQGGSFLSAQGQGLVPAQGHASGSTQGQSFGPAERQGFVPAQGQGSGSAHWQSSGSAQGLGLGPEQGQGFVSAQGQGFVPAHGQGSGFSQGQGAGLSQGLGHGPAHGHGFGLAQGQGFIPTQGQGFVPAQGQGFVPAQGQGFVPAQGPGFESAPGQGFVPALGQGFVPARGQGFVAAQGQGFVAAQGQGFVAAQGQGFVPVQGQGFVPAQSQGFVPAQGQVYFSAQGQAFVPVQGQLVPLPLQNHGFVTAQGQGFVPSQGQFMPVQGHEFLPAQGQGFVQDLGFASAQGQSFPIAHRQVFPGAQGPGLPSAQGSVPSQGQNLGSPQLQGLPLPQNNIPFQGFTSFPGPQQQEWQFSNSASLLSQAPGTLQQAHAASHVLRPKMSTGMPDGRTAWPSQDAQPGKDFAQLIESNFREGRLHEVEVLFNEMKKMQIAVEVPTYNVLLETYSQTGQLDKLDQVFKEMRQVVVQRAEGIREATSPPPSSRPAGGPYQHPSSMQSPLPYSVYDGHPRSLSQVPASRPSPVFTDSVRLPSRVDHTESRPSEWQSTWAKPAVESGPAEWSHAPPAQQVSPLPLIKPADFRPFETGEWMPQVSSSRPVSPFPVVKPGESKARPAVSLSMEPLAGLRPAESTSGKPASPGPMPQLHPVKPAEPQAQLPQAAITRPASPEVTYDVPASESPSSPVSSKSTPDSVQQGKPGLGGGKVLPASDSFTSEFGGKPPSDSASLGFKSADITEPPQMSDPALSSQVPVDKPGFGRGKDLPELSLGYQSVAGRGQALPTPDLGLGDSSGAGRSQALPLSELGLGDKTGAGRGQALPLPALGLVDTSGVGRGQSLPDLKFGDISGAGRGQSLPVSKGIGRGQALPESIPSEQPREQKVAGGLSGGQAHPPLGLGSDGKPGIGRGRGTRLALDSGESTKSSFVPLSLFGHGLDVRPGLGRGRGKATAAPHIWQKPPQEEVGGSATSNVLEGVELRIATGDAAESAEGARAIVAKTTEVDQRAQWPSSRSPRVSSFTRPPQSVTPATPKAPPVRQRLSPKEAAERASAILLERAEKDRALDEAGRERKRVLVESPKTVTLNSDAAVERAMNILQQNLARQGLGTDIVPKVSSGERSSKGRLNSFLEFGFVAQRKRAAFGPSASGEARSVGEQAGRRTVPSSRGRQQSDVSKALTFEEDKKMEIGDAEEATKSALDLKFRRDFDTQLAMEDFGTNPDIEEKSEPTLEEALQEAKHLLMPLGGILDEETWQAGVRDVLARAPQLEKLVEAYSGKGRIAAREQKEQLDMIAGKLPPHASPELTAFTQRALITLQNNPSWKFVQKEQMLKNLVSGFSHY